MEYSPEDISYHFQKLILITETGSEMPKGTYDTMSSWGKEFLDHKLADMSWGLRKHFGETCSSYWSFHFLSWVYSSNAFHTNKSLYNFNLRFFFFPLKWPACSGLCEKRCTTLDWKSSYLSTVSMREVITGCLRQDVRGRKACRDTSHTIVFQVEQNVLLCV